MYAIATFLIVALLSLLFTRVATGVLIATGMPPEAAAFQARSAFTGAGFTTTEAESVVNHPTRRRVVSTTMFVGNLGIPTLVVTVLAGLLAPGPGDTRARGIVLVVGLTFLVLLAFSRPMTRFLVEIGRRSAGPLLKRTLSGTPVPLLTLSDEVQVVAVPLVDGLPWRSVQGLQQIMPQVRVLGVRPEGRPGRFVHGAATDLELRAGDEVVLLAGRDELASLLGNARSRHAAAADPPT